MQRLSKYFLFSFSSLMRLAGEEFLGKGKQVQPTRPASTSLYKEKVQKSIYYFLKKHWHFILFPCIILFHFYYSQGSQKLEIAETSDSMGSQSYTDQYMLPIQRPQATLKHSRFQALAYMLRRTWHICVTLQYKVERLFQSVCAS